MTVYEKLKQEQDSLLEKEESMKMDQNLTVSYEEQKAQWQERKKQQQKENACDQQTHSFHLFLLHCYFTVAFKTLL